MVESGQSQAANTTPSRFPETTPPAPHLSDFSFTLQAIMEMQKTLGQLTQAITTLTEESKKRGEVLDRISHKVYAAQVVLWIAGGLLTALGGVAVFFLNRIWDTILPLVRMKLHP